MAKNKITVFRESLRKFERLNQLMNSRCCRGITMSQCHVLLEIERLDTATTNQLANNLKLDKSTLSRTVDSLVSLALVNRSESLTDRRYKSLILTEKGKELCENINRENSNLYTSVFQKLPPSERDQIFNHFNDLLWAMEKWYESDEKEKGCC
jgi:DNA-binding MarR family transcriptional regulator